MDALHDHHHIWQLVKLGTIETELADCDMCVWSRRRSSGSNSTHSRKNINYIYCWSIDWVKCRAWHNIPIDLIRSNSTFILLLSCNKRKRKTIFIRHVRPIDCDLSMVKQCRFESDMYSDVIECTRAIQTVLILVRTHELIQYFNWQRCGNDISLCSKLHWTAYTPSMSELYVCIIDSFCVCSRLLFYYKTYIDSDLQRHKTNRIQQS